MERLRELGKKLVANGEWLAPALVALVCTWMSVEALYVQSFAIFGRDQGIFQYVAWALKNGERAYVDVRDINGPLPHLWHMVMQGLGGEDEHVFRSIDTWFLAIMYALGASTIPRWIDLETKPPAWMAWALAGVGVLGAQYVRYDWWHTAQREGLYAVLILGSLALQSVGHSSRVKRTSLVCFVGAGALTALTWFGKPPCIVFAALQGIVLVLDRQSIVVTARRAGFAAGAGALVVSLGMTTFVAIYGSIGSCIAVLSDVPKLHHTIWNESLDRAYRMYGNRPRLDWAIATFVAFVITYWLLKLPRRALLATILPIGGGLIFSGQGKAFPYHMHMLTLGTAVTQLVILAAVVKSVRTRDEVYGFLIPIAALALGYKSFDDARNSQAMKADWSIVGATRELRATPRYLDRFPWDDFGAADLRGAAAYLARNTAPSDRVQMYGLDPYLLFLAKRKSATPVIYNFELNVDPALEGGSGAKPSPELRQWLLAHRDATEQRVLALVKATPPAAFVLIDKSPFSHAKDAEKDFDEHCPSLSAFMHERYVDAVHFGVVRVWLRSDLAEKESAPPSTAP
jgi:hypothetical protein